MPSCDPIGIIRTPIDTASEAPRQGELSNIPGEIVLDQRVTDGLQGLQTGAIDVIWYADRADRETLLIDTGTRGVFASRSQDRPNPVCITRCDIVEMSGRRLRVDGVDMLDRTPVLDLKVPLD